MFEGLWIGHATFYIKNHLGLHVYSPYKVYNKKKCITQWTELVEY